MRALWVAALGLPYALLVLEVPGSLWLAERLSFLWPTMLASGDRP